MSSSSIGRGPAFGGNENHDGDPRSKTLGETVQQEPPAGNDLIDEAAADLPAADPGATAKPGTAKGLEGSPDGPNVHTARGKLPPK